MLALQTLYYPEDVRVRDKKEIIERLEGVDVSEEELAMAEQLVAGLAKPFAPEEYPNETRRALVEFLEAKAAGQEIATPEEAPAPAPVNDRMAAHKASHAAASPEGSDGDEEEAPAKPKRKKAASG
jgi:DNA end-binding protein Ku